MLGIGCGQGYRGRETRETKYTQEIGIMIACSFSSASCFSSASTLFWVTLSLKVSQNESLPTDNFSKQQLQNILVFLFCFLPSPGREGNRTTWEHNEIGLSASDEIIPQVTVCSSSEAVAHAAFHKRRPVWPGGKFCAIGRESPGKSRETRAIPVVLCGNFSSRYRRARCWWWAGRG